MSPQDSRRKVQCMRSGECCKIGHVWQFYKIHWWVRCCSLLCARYYPKVVVNSSRKTAYLKQSKASKFVIECKFKQNSNKFRDQMETLHSPGEVLPLLRHRGMCRCLWHRVRLSKFWRHTPPKHSQSTTWPQRRKTFTDTSVHLFGSRISFEVRGRT